jgi:hypothetical protein
MPFGIGGPEVRSSASQCGQLMVMPDIIRSRAGVAFVCPVSAAPIHCWLAENNASGLMLEDA